jgi:hypothetical protein
VASDVDNLKATRSSLIQTLATEAAYQATNGPKPTYSIDGESVSWDEWREATLRQIDELTALIVKLQAPTLIRSRGRA